MLLERNRQIMADPRLWAIYDNHPIRDAKEFNIADPIFQAKLQVFCYLTPDMFKVIIEEGTRTSPRREGELLRNLARILFGSE